MSNQQLVSPLPLIYILFFLLISLLGFAIYNSYHKKGENMAFCGVIDSYPIRIKGHNYIDIAQGKMLFKNNCASCHAGNMKTDLTGPALSDSFKNFGRDTSLFIEYVRNPNAYRVKYQNARHLLVYEKYGKLEKPNYPSFSKDDVISIIHYIDDKCTIH